MREVVIWCIVCVCVWDRETDREREGHEHFWQDRAQILVQRRTGVQSDTVFYVCVSVTHFTGYINLLRN